MTSGKFNLADYVTVAERLEKFWEEYPEGRIDTALVSNAGGKVVIKASVYRNIGDPAPTSTGHAHEVEGQGMVNTTSAMENCETSAVGRALALMGYEIKKGIASREEMAAAAQRPQAAPPQRSQPQGAQGKPQATGSGAPSNAAVMPYGKSKGKPITEAPYDDLVWMRDTINTAEKLNDPRWGDNNRLLLAALEAELYGRDGISAEDMGKEVEGDGTPF